MKRSETEGATGKVTRLEAGLRMVLAGNPSPMTGRGTNTYIVGSGAVAVIDPGPDDTRHMAAILAALEPGERISHILVTHAHLDHSPLSRALSGRTGAPVLAFGGAGAGRSATMAALAHTGLLRGGEGVDTGFAPDRTLADGDIVRGGDWALRAIHTPGHFANHLSFAATLPDGPVIFSGDHVMGWATSLVSPPDGDMGAYFRSLDRLAREPARRFHPGHGDPVADPAARIAELRTHRRMREAQILAALASGPANAATLARSIYLDTPPALLPAAERNVLAHLIDLSEQGRVTHPGPITPATEFRLTEGAKIF